MEKMRVCFVGIGSIAKRHIRNLHRVCDISRIELSIDAFRQNGGRVEGIEHVYTDFRSLPSNYDAIFITNPTELHLETLIRFHDKGKHFFIEKPVVSFHQIEEAKLFKKKSESVYYVACPLRYNAVIQWVKKSIRVDEIISIRSISSSYLPDWRPGQDYRKTYSAHKNLGGGVSIDLIHEWDYLTFLFGWPDKVLSFIGKKSKLEIDSDDYAIYIAEYNDKIVELHLDYFGREPIRKLELITEDDTIICDLINHSIEFLKAKKIIDLYEERDDYQMRELSHFLNLIKTHSNESDDYNHGLKVLELTQGRM